MPDIHFLIENSWKKWDTFCLDSDDAWFWHTSKWLDYTVHLRQEMKTEQKSFYILKESKIVAICPLLINIVKDGDYEVKFFSFDRYNGEGPALRNNLPINERERLLKIIFSNINLLASENEIDLCLMSFSPLAKTTKKSNYILKKFGFLNTSQDSTIIDLSHDNLLLRMRKGHRQNIKKGNDAYIVEIFDKYNIYREIFNQYQYLHYKSAGKMTRPQITFDRMYSWIQSGDAFLAGLKYNSEYIAFTFVITYKSRAHYASACDDPEIDAHIPVHPLLQWKIIEYLKKEGYCFYEIGLQQFGNQLYDLPSEKNITISFFKRGFGGDIVPVFSGEKWYSESYFRRKMESRIEEYCHRVFKI